MAAPSFTSYTRNKYTLTSLHRDRRTCGYSVSHLYPDWGRSVEKPKQFCVKTTLSRARHRIQFSANADTQKPKFWNVNIINYIHCNTAKWNKDIKTLKCSLSCYRRLFSVLIYVWQDWWFIMYVTCSGEQGNKSKGQVVHIVGIEVKTFISESLLG